MKLPRTIILTTSEIADALEHMAHEFAGIDYRPQDFYCGIGKDMDERAQWHKTDNLMFIKTDSRESAGDVETEMAVRGFNTGARPDNGGTPESIYVYIYPVTPYTRETADQT